MPSLETDLEQDPRIAMVAGYRPPRRRTFWEKHTRLRALLVSLVLLVLLFIGLVLTDFLLVSRSRSQVLGSVADYHPKQITRLVAPNGETVAEFVGERRTVLPPDKQPALLAKAVIAAREPAFFTRRGLGTIDMLRAVGDKIRGTHATPPLSVALVRRLRPDDGGFGGLLEAWLSARRMERDLSREDILAVYLNEVPFGAGRFGIEEGARAMFDRSAAALDATQTKALAAKADRDDGPPPPARKFTAAPGCGKAAAAELSTRFDVAALARMGSVVVTTSCDPTLSKAVEEIVEKQDLARTGLSAAVVVLRLPSHEISALVGDPGLTRPIGNLRVPLIFAAALSSLKFTPLSPVNDHGTTLRTMAGIWPQAAADALLTAGLSTEAVRELATKIGLRSNVDAAALAHGTAPVNLLDAASMLATFIDFGQLRQPQLIRSVGAQAESEAARLVVKAMTPEVAYLALSLSLSAPAPASVPRKVVKEGTVTHGTDAWTVLGMPDAVLAVWIGYPDGHTLPVSGDGERASVAIAHGVLGVLLHGHPQPLLPRPSGLVERRLDGNGRLLPQGARSGAVEWFIPGSLPREDGITREPEHWPSEHQESPPAPAPPAGTDTPHTL